MRVIEGYGALPALGLLDRKSKSETTGPAEWVRGSNPAALGLLLYEARGTPPKKLRGGQQKDFGEKNVFPKKYVELRTFDGTL